MKKNIRVELVDKEQNSCDCDNDISLNDKVTVITGAAEDLGKKALIGYAGYVLLDTFRRVSIELARRPRF